MTTTKTLAALVFTLVLVGGVSAGLPPDWHQADIGSNLEPGSVLYNEADGRWTIEVSCSAAGDSPSGCYHYVYTSLNGDGHIIACIQSIDVLFGTAGVEIREGLDVSSKYASANIRELLGQLSGHFAYRRSDIDSVTGPNTQIDQTPYWVRLERRGDTFTGYISADGSDWTEVGSEQISMSTSILVGLSVGAELTGSGIAEFDSVTVEGKGDNDWVVSDSNMYSIPAGNVGIGTKSPASKLEVIAASSKAVISAANDGTGECIGVMGVASNTGDVKNFGGAFISEGTKGTGVSGLANGSNGIGIFGASPGNNGMGVSGYSTGSNGFGVVGLATGADGIGVQAQGNGANGCGILASGARYAGYFNGDVKIVGNLDTDGSIYQRGSQLHADYVFESSYELEPIDKHSQFMWQHRHLKAIPKAIVDDNGQEIVEVGTYCKGIVEELEKAHIYIEQLHKRMKSLEEKLAKLEAKFSAVE